MQMAGCLRAKSFGDAGLLLDESLGIYEMESPDSWKLFHVKAIQGKSRLGDGKLTESEPLLLTGIEGLICSELLPKQSQPRCVSEGSENACGLFVVYS